MVWVCLFLLFAGIGYLVKRPSDRRVFAGILTIVVTPLVLGRFFVLLKSQNPTGRSLGYLVKLHLEGGAEAEPLLLEKIVDSIRFALSWSYVGALTLIGVGVAIDAAGTTTKGRVYRAARKGVSRQALTSPAGATVDAGRAIGEPQQVILGWSERYSVAEAGRRIVQMTRAS